MAARTGDVHGRIILDLEWVEKPGGEAAVAVNCLRRLAPLLPGAQAVVYDTALRGVHHQVLLRDLGLVPVNLVTSERTMVPRPGVVRRLERTVHVEDKTVALPDGTKGTIRLYARAGAVGLAERTETGDLLFVELRRVRTHRNRDRNGRYRWYNDYALPGRYGGGRITVRLHANSEDRARGFNRTERFPDAHELEVPDRVRCLEKLVVAQPAEVEVAPGGSAGHQLDVSLAEYSITPSLQDVRGGTVTFQVQNSGKVDHEMVVIKTDDAPGGLPFENGEASEQGSMGEIPEIVPGETKTLTLKLPAGHYVLICNLPGHYIGGMHVGFVVS